MKILVTGGSGFIGSHLIEELLGHGHVIASLDIRDPRERVGGVAYIKQDFCLFDELLECLRNFKPEAIAHLGAVPSVQKSIDMPMGTMRNNVEGTYSVLEAARQTGVLRVVLISSGATYGKTAFEYSGKKLPENVKLAPLNPYGLSKAMLEDMGHIWASKEIWQGPDTVSLRFSNVFGPRQPRDAAYASCIERFMHQWKAGEPFTVVPDGHQRRDMVFVADAVRAVRLACESEKDFYGEAINIGSGKNFSILEIADLIGGKNHPKVFMEPRVGEIRETLFDIQKAKNLFNWQPEISFEKGIEILKQDN
ncbi:MAG: NAD-dependent epimerase/dehydratase family protein [Patescibacteria group bacterium]